MKFSFTDSCNLEFTNFFKRSIVCACVAWVCKRLEDEKSKNFLSNIFIQVYFQIWLICPFEKMKELFQISKSNNEVTFQKAKSIVNICGNFLKCRSYKCNYFLEHTLIVATGRYWLIIFNSWDRWNSSVGDIILSRYEVVWNSRFYHQDHLDFVKHLINVLMICLKKFILIVNGWL